MTKMTRGFTGEFYSITYVDQQSLNNLLKPDQARVVCHAYNSHRIEEENFPDVMEEIMPVHIPPECSGWKFSYCGCNLARVTEDHAAHMSIEPYFRGFDSSGYGLLGEMFGGSLFAVLTIAEFFEAMIGGWQVPPSGRDIPLSLVAPWDKRYLDFFWRRY